MPADPFSEDYIPHIPLKCKCVMSRVAMMSLDGLAGRTGTPHMGSCGQGAVHMEQAAKQGSMGALGRETISHLSRPDHTMSDTC